MIFFGEKCPRFHAGAGASQAFDFRFFVRSFRWKRKVSLLTELRLEPKLFSTKMPPLRG